MWDKLGTPVTIGSNQPEKPSNPTQSFKKQDKSSFFDKYDNQIIGEDGHIFYRRIIPADNSCLFNAFSKSFGTGIRAEILRKMMSDAILSNPSVYTEAVLEKNPKEYAHWIQKSESWGGAIELQFLAETYKIEICAVDIQNCFPYHFYPKSPSPKRIILIFDGVHYDYIAKGIMEEMDPREDITQFETSQSQAIHNALCIANDLRKKRQFTDKNTFSLRCKVCLQGLIGQKEAIEHGKETGHSNFEEFR